MRRFRGQRFRFPGKRLIESQHQSDRIDIFSFMETFKKDIAPSFKYFLVFSRVNKGRGVRQQ
jgi:hypothetical protein